MPAASTLFEAVVLLYTLVLLLLYTTLAVAAGWKLRQGARKQEAADTYLLLNSPLQPSVTIVAPCYNESVLIVDSVSALMRLEYDRYEVVVVNDGSRDDSLDVLVRAFALYRTDEEVPALFSTAAVRGVYRSSNPAWYNLRVVDKENGGKADALNAGVALSQSEYLIALDADSVLVPKALRTLVGAVIRSSDDEPVVAVGGAVGIANGCRIDRGVVVSTGAPKNYLASIQAVEYARAFLLGRMGWSAFNSLVLVSGALGMFRRADIVEVGGYRSTSIAEDLELLVRMRRRLTDRGIRHRVLYVPQTLLWTEVPSTFRVLMRQRIRWTKGLISTLVENRSMAFNARYGRLGWVVYPYWVFYEWLAPLVETAGIVYFVVMVLVGSVNWPFFVFLALFMFLFGGVFSVTGVLFEQLSVHAYGRKRDVVRLFARGITELFVFHPWVTWAALAGNFQYFFRRRRRTVWGDMPRRGHSR